MNYLLKRDDIAWLPNPHTLTIYPSTTLPPDALITSVHVFAFLDEKLLMAHVRKRRWEIPGGHREQGEEIMSALIREVKEETNACISHASLIAYSKIHLQGQKIESYAYPYPISYQVFFIADIKMAALFTETDEVIASFLWTEQQVLTSSWGEDYASLYKHALQNWKTRHIK